MKSHASLLAMLTIAAGTLLGAASGCELIASIDRNKIQETGGAGGEGGTTNTAGGGGTTSSSSTTDGGGGTTSSSTNPGCVDPQADCGPPSADCKEFSCVDGACVEGDVADGTLAATQTAMDCKRSVCAGGVAISENDNTDPLDDGEDCTLDVCDAGNPASNPADIGFSCSNPMGGVCNGNGACVECNSDADCMDANEPDCLDNQCVPETCSDTMLNAGETDVDCGGPCQGCDTNENCSVDGDCYHGICGGNGKCDAPACNDMVKNGGDYLADNGETDVDCGGPCGSTCGPMKNCEVDGDCTGMACTGAGGTCVPNCLDEVNNNAETDVDCGGGTCGGCAVNKDCDGLDTNCVGTAFCNVMTDLCAAKKPNGDACAGTNQCTSGFCVDGVCCDVACGGTCASCNLPTLAGVCSNIQLGQDPDDECDGNGGADVCDGSAACGEANGSACTTNGECASGTCVDDFCCNSACDGLCEACSNTKTGAANGACMFVPNNLDPDTECTASLACNGSGQCQPKLAQGSACTVGQECQTNFCADGVCCNGACGATCQACTAAKKGTGADGLCGNIAVGQDPDNECLGLLACSGGACQPPFANGTACNAGVECNSGFCVDSVCCNSACNGVDCEACDVTDNVGVCSPVLAGDDPDNDCNAGDPELFCNGAGACGLGAAGAPCLNNAGCASNNCLGNGTCSAP